jgi:flagellar biosynthetic protein FlhB
MAEDFDDSKTEAPTQRRREEARQQGQVAVSNELTAGILLLTGVLVLWMSGPRMAGGLLQAVQQGLLMLRRTDLGPEAVQEVMGAQFAQAGQLLAYLLGALFVVACGVGVLQVGFHIVPELLLPKWEKLSPAEGWSRLFSIAAVVRGIVAILKVTAVALLAVWVLRGRMGKIVTLGEGNLSYACAQTWDIAIRLALAIAASLALIGVLDYAYQRFRFERALRMSRQELKEELKREEGDPQVRARIRKMHREAARRRMMQEVPKATVVITNPVHLAVALRYERGEMAAPRVVAKGAGLLAERIIELARENDVPVLERKATAQALFKAVQVGQDIPESLYLAVAEILAYLYRLRTEKL